ncbi:TPA: GTPase ObgE [Candidatus Saccharibacteria bacterium]|nr:GTPase ObgE [Candidatus Saccharibacteria bacterium]HIO87632.1 GTPase ObgE [Candidatus Saccharibacteria bacterium]
MFVDTATVFVKAGNGGNGAKSFRREIYVDRGGPDGGDGGDGGNVVFVAQKNTNTLANFRHDPKIKADHGKSGAKRRQRGKSGEDKIVVVPVGTVVTEDDTVLGDLYEEGQQLVVAKGGEGGFGNAHFKSSTRQAPQVAELGTPGEEKELTLELKLVADVGLIGLPNAGKSTLLKTVSAARPKVADYPFTTLVPNLGVAEFDETSLVIADIPGLIEGASEGKGLGDEFLRHVERTGVLVHLIDASAEDPKADQATILKEVSKRDLLKDKPVVSVLTKIDLIEPDRLIELKKQFSSETLAISSVAKKGTLELLRLAKQTATAHFEKTKLQEESEKPDMPVYTVEETKDDWFVRKHRKKFIVEGKAMERFALKTNADDYFGRTRLYNIFERKGIIKELEKLGYDGSQDIHVADKVFNFDETA